MRNKTNKTLVALLLKSLRNYADSRKKFAISKLSDMIGINRNIATKIMQAVSIKGAKYQYFEIVESNKRGVILKRSEKFKDSPLQFTEQNAEAILDIVYSKSNKKSSKSIKSTLQDPEVTKAIPESTKEENNNSIITAFIKLLKDNGVKEITLKF